MPHDISRLSHYGESVAQALLQLLSRVGILKEIVTDQGTAFFIQDFTSGVPLARD